MKVFLEKAEALFEKALYNVRMLLLVPVLFLVFLFMTYLVQHIGEMYHHAISFDHTERNSQLLLLFEGVELILTSSFVYMLIIGTYHEMISEIDHLTKMPSWLKHLDMNSLKVKLAVSLIGLSSTHLMSDFINPLVSREEWIKRVIIHVVLCGSAFAIKTVLGNWLHSKKEDEEEEKETAH